MKEIKYCDGDIEKYIEEILKNSDNLSSNENIAEKKYSSWPIRYHLSYIRSNAIRHLNFNGLDILELGAGMGAVSRFVAENSKTLTVVEGTQQRMNCLKQRLRDLENWEGYVTNYQDFNTDKKYDVVCFFGVLEYAGRYIDSDDPFLFAINHAKSFLKEDGVLIITIENKNGLKYFSGAKEDHYNEKFYGICGYPEINDIKTFSKKEMIEILKKSGFDNVDVHHLSPDYKLTRSVLTEEFVNEQPIISANIESNYDFENYGSEREILFPEKLAMVSIAKSGLLSEFSNSYLFLASNKSSKIRKSLLKNVEDENIKAFLYTYGRKNEVVTKFIKNNNEYTTHKEFINQKNQKNDLNNFEDEPLYSGTELSFLLCNYAYYNKKDKFIDLVCKHINDVFENFKTEDNNILMKESFDAIIRNTQFADNKFIYYDKEFLPPFDINKSYFILREVIDLYKIIKYFKKFDFNTKYDFYLYLCKRFNIEQNLEKDIEKEIIIQNKVTNNDINSLRRSYKKFIKEPIISKKKNNLYLIKKVKSGNKYKIKFFGITIFSYNKKI